MRRSQRASAARPYILFDRETSPGCSSLESPGATDIHGSMLPNFGWILPGRLAEGVSPRDAIETVRALRPGSVETPEQEEAVLRYARSTRGRRPAAGER